MEEDENNDWLHKATWNQADIHVFPTLQVVDHQ
jgi:hypothetical protein